MRLLANLLLLLAIVLGATRLFTGVVYGVDSPVAYFIVKTVPDVRMERPEAEGRPIEREIVLDTEESQLAYGWLYFAIMKAVPALLVITIGMSAALYAAAHHRHRARA